MGILFFSATYARERHFFHSEILIHKRIVNPSINLWPPTTVAQLA